ncbi:hypothetical protein BX600DRAFT_512573 [Xylariales sp. PMI_506]|nr:hypothetical protein BX600DRAFT_512573 [Xylariales sp. PMI_506]
MALSEDAALLSTKPQRRVLDKSKREIRLLSFKSNLSDINLLLGVHYVSLDDQKPEYQSFCKTSSSKASEYSEAWSSLVEIDLDTPRWKIHKQITRFAWGDYIGLSGVWQEGVSAEHTTLLLDGASVVIERSLYQALRDVQSSAECRLGMYVWVEALCVDNADTSSPNSHTSYITDIVSEAFSVSIWTEERKDLALGATPRCEFLVCCENILARFGRSVLEQALGVRHRDWGAVHEADEEINSWMEYVEPLQFEQTRSTRLRRGVDCFGIPRHHIRDLVAVELSHMLQMQYWLQPLSAQILSDCPTASTVYWGDSLFQLTTVLVVTEILSAFVESGRSLSLVSWEQLEPGLKFLAAIDAERRKKE